MSGSASPMSSLSTYHQTLSNHISSLLSQLPPSAAVPAPAPTTTDRTARDQEFKTAWEAEGHARHTALPKDFTLQLAASGSKRSSSRSEPCSPRAEGSTSASVPGARDRQARRVERSKRRIEAWRARMDVTCLASPSIPPTPLAPTHTTTTYFPTPPFPLPLPKNDSTSKLPLALPVPLSTSFTTTAPAKAVFGHSPCRLQPTRRSIDAAAELERIALEREINERLARAGPKVPGPVNEKEVLDSLAHCLGLVTDLAKVPEAVRQGRKRSAGMERQQATASATLQLL